MHAGTGRIATGSKGECLGSVSKQLSHRRTAKSVTSLQGSAISASARPLSFVVVVPGVLLEAFLLRFRVPPCSGLVRWRFVTAYSLSVTFEFYRASFFLHFTIIPRHGHHRTPSQACAQGSRRRAAPVRLCACDVPPSLSCPTTVMPGPARGPLPLSPRRRARRALRTHSRRRARPPSLLHRRETGLSELRMPFFGLCPG